MGLSRSRTLYLIALLALVVLSLRPVREVDGIVEQAFLPARALGLLMAPFDWLRTRSVRAAEEDAARGLESERQAARALLADEQAGARPPRPELVEGRSLIPVRFVERLAEAPDTIVARCAPGVAIEVGAPVVSGDVFVGRVRATRAEHSADRAKLRDDELLIDLVTARSFRVGSRIEARGPDSAAIDLVVGGLLESPSSERESLFLATHVVSDRRVWSGVVRVAEARVPAGAPGSAPPSIGAGPQIAALADGYLLGEMLAYPLRGSEVFGVRAALDYGAGLHQMFVLGTPGREDAAELALDPFAPEAWIEAELVAGGNPSFWRAGSKLLLSRFEGARDHAAVAVGARWVGRIAHAGPWSSSVSFAGDAGLAIHALARVDGIARPIVIGKLVSLGRAGDRARFAWATVLPVGAEARAGEAPWLDATLYTSSESRSVPPGLLIGRTRLPRGRGSFVLEVDVAAVPSDLRRVLVWRAGERAALPEEAP